MMKLMAFLLTMLIIFKIIHFTSAGPAGPARGSKSEVVVEVNQRWRVCYANECYVKTIVLKRNNWIMYTETINGIKHKSACDLTTILCLVDHELLSEEN